MSEVSADGFYPDTFFARLHEGERAGLRELAREHGFAEGAVLMFEHELEERVMLLLSGRVKVTRVSADGRELLLTIRDSGDVLGELALIDGAPRTATVAALEPVRALVMSGSAFRAYLEATPRVAVVLLEVVAQRFRAEMDKRLQFTVLDTMGRLCARILELAERYGERDGSGTVVVMPISQEELASWTGASRAGVAQAMQGLRELGWISTERRRLLVRDPQALRARAG